LGAKGGYLEAATSDSAGTRLVAGEGNLDTADIEVPET